MTFGRFEWIFTRKELRSRTGGRPVRMEVEVGPIAGGVEGFFEALALVRDVTEREMAEERVRDAERMAVAEQIAMKAAHEIRNPLTSIRGFIQILQKRISTMPEKEYLNIMLEEVNRIDDLTGQMLMMSRRGKLNPKMVDLNEFLTKVCSMIEIARDDPRIEIVKEFEPDLPPVSVDTGQMKQAVLNVLKNAVEAMPLGGKLRVGTSFDPDNRLVELRISDTGEGIPAEDLPYIFFPFFTRKENGTGLGLAATLGVVESHEGRIEVETVPGEGTTFTMIFPLSTGGKGEEC